METLPSAGGRLVSSQESRKHSLASPSLSIPSSSALAHSLMLLFFIYAGYVQGNDPDGAMWMALYSTAALACVLRMARLDGPARMLSDVGLISALSLLALTSYSAPVSSWFDFALESGREQGGSLIMVIWAVTTTRGLSRGEGEGVCRKCFPVAAVLFPLAVLVAAYAIPKVMVGVDTPDHCKGLGVQFYAHTERRLPVEQHLFVPTTHAHVTN
ncbi:unnamed protein product [Vitrella brassicaformis CCMP3155]|uniref:Uncharacterized protein n=1 Tax=Vitrella brassicaformis (strain CCMP3155) TaxID=1169540 RepID=A0A0G4F790_VITBC|nr:unnamed protein product [Vitrella brassicaformis CCMP3155]|mmetsp:Transcript_9127/g.26276  ORF Transcript_9127/g.26276 Transcript_9127/m.26276 type:complete len:214 (-) Transcript_9127:959-1600(-)|eukprot:CEM08120.1 unnamed protein product [Vitrella brassicaformis CCMP3155]